MLLLLAAPGFAQTQQGPPANETKRTPDSTAVVRVDADALPISIERIQRRLAQVPPSSRSGLKLEYYVEVVGKAPPIDVFGTFDVKNGPVPWAGVTHREFLDLVTPQEFRSPPMDFSAFFRWLSERLEKKTKQ